MLEEILDSKNEKTYLILVNSRLEEWKFVTGRIIRGKVSQYMLEPSKDGRKLLFRDLQAGFKERIELRESPKFLFQGDIRVNIAKDNYNVWEVVEVFVCKSIIGSNQKVTATFADDFAGRFQKLKKYFEEFTLRDLSDFDIEELVQSVDASDKLLMRLFCKQKLAPFYLNEKEQTLEEVELPENKPDPLIFQANEVLTSSTYDGFFVGKTPINKFVLPPRPPNSKSLTCPNVHWLTKIYPS